MSIAIVRLFPERGLTVIGIDNNMREHFFGPEASTRWQVELLAEQPNDRHHVVDIRDADAIQAIFRDYGRDIAAIVHCAAQPSHDWAVRDPVTDFTVNANGTLTLLEATRGHAPDAVFIFVSTNKVYGDRPNHLPLVERETLWELSPDHEWAEHGFPEDLAIDRTLHSLFGASKTAADVLVEGYGPYFGTRTACFREGCLTGPGHSEAPLHGFLTYLMRCAVTDPSYTVFGYKGKQVRDDIHVRDVVEAFLRRPTAGAVFNLGGGRHSNCSVLEANSMAEEPTGQPMTYVYGEEKRIGDHMWWISDVSKFQAAYPEWRYRYDIKTLMADIHAGVTDRFGAE